MGRTAATGVSGCIEIILNLNKVCDKAVSKPETACTECTSLRL